MKYVKETQYVTEDNYTKLYGFTVGDKVRVVKDSWLLVLGGVYTVYGFHERSGAIFVSVTGEENADEQGHFLCRFVKYEEPEETAVQENKKINPEKKYRMVNTHEPVRVICTDRKDSTIPCVGLYTSEAGNEGVVFFGNTGKGVYGNDLVEEVPVVDWSAVKVDTPIWVKIEARVLKRHFNKFEDGKVHYWPNGGTSFTYEGRTSRFDYVESYDAFLEEPK